MFFFYAEYNEIEYNHTSFESKNAHLLKKKKRKQKNV